jgi:hypothetical protein
VTTSTVSVTYERVPLTTLAPTTTPALDSVLYRINAGGGRYLDPNGNVWLGDRYIYFGLPYGNLLLPIAGTELDPVYQTERYDPFIFYNIPVPLPELYHVRLHFADIFTGTNGVGLRFFKVTVENQVVAESLDIVEAVGWATALVLNTTVAVYDGLLTVALTALPGGNNPKISGIEVFGSAEAAALVVLPLPTSTTVPSTSATSTTVTAVTSSTSTSTSTSTDTSDATSSSSSTTFTTTSASTSTPFPKFFEEVEFEERPFYLYGLFARTAQGKREVREKMAGMEGGECWGSSSHTRGWRRCGARQREPAALWSRI